MDTDSWEDFGRACARAGTDRSAVLRELAATWSAGLAPVWEELGHLAAQLGTDRPAVISAGTSRELARMRRQLERQHAGRRHLEP